MTLPYWMGGIVLEAIKRSGVGAGVAILFGVLLMFGAGWLIRFWLQMKKQVRIRELDLDVRKFDADQQHLKNLENEGSEWREFLGVHMTTIVAEIKGITEEIKTLTKDNCKTSAKQIEGLRLLQASCEAGFTRVNSDHTTIEEKVDSANKGISTMQGFIQGQHGHG